MVWHIELKNVGLQKNESGRVKCIGRGRKKGIMCEEGHGIVWSGA